MKLTRFEIIWAKAALDAMFPGSSENGLEGIGAMDIGGYLNDVMRTRPFKAALGLRVAVWLVAVAPLFLFGRASTITALADADRERLLDRLLSSRVYAVRMLVMLMKTFGALLYAGNDRVRARLRPALLRAGPNEAPPIVLRLERSRVA